MLFSVQKTPVALRVNFAEKPQSDAEESAEENAVIHGSSSESNIHSDDGAQEGEVPLTSCAFSFFTFQCP